jgi:hypothetical protein
VGIGTGRAAVRAAGEKERAGDGSADGVLSNRAAEARGGQSGIFALFEAILDTPDEVAHLLLERRDLFFNFVSAHGGYLQAHRSRGRERRMGAWCHAIQRETVMRWVMSRLPKKMQDASQAARMAMVAFMVFLPAGLAGGCGVFIFGLFTLPDRYDETGP